MTKIAVVGFVGGSDVFVIAGHCGLAGAATAIICTRAQRIGEAIGLIDHPDGVRKTHGRDTPLIGGLALLVPSFLVSATYLLSVDFAPFMFVAIVASVLILLVGVIDDKFGISPVWRLLVMTYLVFTTFSLEPTFVVHSLRLGVFDSLIRIPVDPLAGPFTVLIVLGFVNASNMADGMNGQLLGSVVIWCAFIALHLGTSLAMPFFAIICSALVTIIFNLRDRLFSGSSGAYAASLFVALGTLAVYHRSAGSMTAQMPLFWFWLPIVDCVRLMVMRTLHGKSPLGGDRNHFHHKLLDYLRVRYALPIYLTLLAAPGVAEEIDPRLGGMVFLLCLAFYLAVLVAYRFRAQLTNVWQKVLPPARRQEAYSAFPRYKWRRDPYLKGPPLRSARECPPQRGCASQFDVK